MRRTVLVLVAAGAAAVAAAAAPAGAADQEVVASPSNVWEPDTVNILAGEQVTFRNGGGLHNLKFEDEAVARNAPSSQPWTAVRRFDAAGRFGFVCEVHAGQGMRGVVVVTAQGSAPPPPPPPAFTARPLRQRFCTRRSPTCRRPGIVLRVSVKSRSYVTGDLQRKTARGTYRADGRVRFTAPAGTSSVRLPRRTNRRRIGPGSYRLTLRARGGEGLTPPVIVRFSVRSS
jgi:plastocyanin